MNTSNTLLTRAISIALFGLASSQALATSITRDFTASWINPLRDKQGVVLEVVESNQAKTLVMYWFTYDASGRPLWIVGSGPVQGNQAAFTAYTGDNGSFDSQRTANLNTWGNISIQFSNCQTGTLNYQSSQGSGSLSLNRFSQLFQSVCSGGLSDDLSAARSEQRSTIYFTNTGLFPAASGKVRYEARAGRVDFNVEAEDLPIGEYDVRVGGTQRGRLRVITVTGGTEGEIEWRSPAEPGHPLLDFDPLGKEVEIVALGGVALRGVVENATVGTDNPPPISGSASLYQLVLEPQGNDGPELHAKYLFRTDRQEFSIELEDVPVGSYSVFINSVARGSVEVVTVQGGTEGEAEYRNPAETGKLPLDFDPRGQRLVVRNSAGASVFDAVFPTIASTITDDDDDGGGNDDPPPVMSLAVELQNVGPDGNANGHASYETSALEREFEVEVEDLADGNYELVVGGTVRATLQVADEEARIKFRDPPRDGSPALNFNPVGQLIEVVQGGTVYLRGTLQ